MFANSAFAVYFFNKSDLTSGYSYTGSARFIGFVSDEDKIIGHIELDVGKKAKTGLRRVKGKVSFFDGTKVRLTPASAKESVTASGGGCWSGNSYGPLNVKLKAGRLGTLDVKFAVNSLGLTTFAGSLGSYHVQGCIPFFYYERVWQSTCTGGPSLKVYSISHYTAILENCPAEINGAVVQGSCLPTGEAVSVKEGKRFVMRRAAKVSYRAAKGSSPRLVVDTAGGKSPNVSGLKLAYNKRNGMFKGGFTVYAVDPVKGKLKKIKAKILGMLVDYAGFGEAVIKGVDEACQFELHTEEQAWDY